MAEQERQPEKIGATKIAEAVVAGMFPIPRHLCVPNVSWSLLPYEADLLAMTSSGYLIEVEIKISLSDLKRDTVKTKWNCRAFDQLVSRFYYAMPASLWSKNGVPECVREGAGVISVERDRNGVLRTRMEREATRTSARPLTPQQQFDLARVGSYRAWSPYQRHRQRQLRAEHAMQEKMRTQQWNDFFEARKASAALAKDSA
jgi:hypothetical protein